MLRPDRWQLQRHQQANWSSTRERANVVLDRNSVAGVDLPCILIAHRGHRVMKRAKGVRRSMR
jgi:hypothetical protein